MVYPLSYIAPFIEFNCISRLLIEHGARVDIVNEEGESPAFIAIDARNRSLVTFMRQHGLGPNKIIKERTSAI